MINPLPQTLYHYSEALTSILQKAGVETRPTLEVSVEADGRSHFSRGTELMRATLAARAHGDMTIVLWPTFGYAETGLMRLLRPIDAVIFHDARPLRQQFMMARWQGRALAPLTWRRRPQVIVHTHAAQDVLTGMSWRTPPVLPHPVLPRHTRARVAQPSKPICLVLGQFKPSRSVEILQQLPGLLQGWDLRLVGRGWPPLTGWTVTAEFVSEARVAAELDAANVVLIPYASFFQSGVMVRALEHSTPVVSIRHEQTQALFGDAWPGMVESWAAATVADAILRCARLPLQSLSEVAVSVELTTVNAWGRFLAERGRSTLPGSAAPN